MVIVREKWAEHTVNQTRCQDLVVACAAFTLEEAAGETSVRGEFFFILNLEGHEVYALSGLFGRYYCRKEHSVAHAQFYRSIGLLCKFAGLQCDGTTVRQRDGFFDWIHKLFLFSA